MHLLAILHKKGIEGLRLYNKTIMEITKQTPVNQVVRNRQWRSTTTHKENV